VTQVAVVPANRSTTIVGQDIVAVVHNTSDRDIVWSNHEETDGGTLAPSEHAVVHGPASAFAVGGDGAVTVDENAIEPYSPLAESSPQAAIQALREEITRERAALQADRDEFERQKQEVTDLESRAAEAKAALEWAKEQSAQPDPPARKPNRKAATVKRAATPATPKKRSR
jgi:hypothetical protein